MALQYLVERFHALLEESEDDENGIMIMDSRMHNLNLEVAKSHLSFIFGHDTGKTFDKIIEAPMFADSRLTVGLQVTDIIGSCIYTNYYYKNSMFFPGATDYSHMDKYWSYLSACQFRSRDLYDGYPRNGYRLIDYHSWVYTWDFRTLVTTTHAKCPTACDSAVISVGADNKFGHPSDEVLAKLQEKLSPENIYRTDQHGTVEFTTDGGEAVGGGGEVKN